MYTSQKLCTKVYTMQDTLLYFAPESDVLVKSSTFLCCLFICKENKCSVKLNKEIKKRIALGAKKLEKNAQTQIYGFIYFYISYMNIRAMET